MQEIVCATRGGEGSRAVQNAAIAEAKASGYPLVFLYVVSPFRESGFSVPLQAALQEELTWLGKTILHVARTRAAAAGQQARMVIRTGPVEEAIAQYVNEVQASLLLLGAPRQTTTQVFGDDAVERFAARLCEQTGVEVRIIRPDRALPREAPLREGGKQDDQPNHAQ